MFFRHSIFSSRGTSTLFRSDRNVDQFRGDESLFKRAAECIREAQALVICAGAGIGVDSGLPEFRGKEGFWKAYPPFKKLGLDFMDIANPKWFHTDPELAWGFYGHRLNLYRNTVPHVGFSILKKIAEEKKKGYFIYTSNVDGQFQKAGFDPNCIVECHGSIHHIQQDKKIISAENLQVHVDEETFRASKPPTDPQGNVIRPNVLMFSDWGWISTRTIEQENRMNQWLESIYACPSVKLAIIEVGAGSAVITVRRMSDYIACRHGVFFAKIIRINIREPHVASPHLGLPFGAKEALINIEKYL